MKRPCTVRLPTVRLPTVPPRTAPLRMAGPLAALLGMALLAPRAAAARDLPYGAVTDPAVQRCDALNWSAQHAQAAACYRRLAGGAATVAEQAEGAWALGDLPRANELFRAAVAARPEDAAVRVRWGELYIDSHQPQQALELFKEALQRDSHDDYAKVDSAIVLADEFQSQADADLNAVTQDASAPPGARLRALLLGARVALEDSDAAAAGPLIEQAATLAAQAHLSDLQVDTLRAALAQFRGGDGGEWIQRALREDPGFGDAYAVPAHFYDLRWRESEAIELYRKAILIQPDLWSAQVELAGCLLREDHVAQARSLLEAAYRGDPYDPVTVNTLRLLDSLAKYQVLDFGHLAGGGPALILRISPEESAVLAPYARRLAEQAMRLYAQRYRFQPRSPVAIEIYPNHDDLAVRTAGLPGMGGELGVTFGYVVAIDSPGTREEGAFDWGSTLWHEMAHVFTLESTDFRVPRWLTEGLSVFEEWRTGPIRGIEIPDYAFAAFAQGHALPIAQLNRGFVHPQYPQQLVVSYMQAGLVCDFIDRSFGFDKLLALLHAFEHTSDVSEALQRSLGLTAEQFDRRFQADLSQRYGALLAHESEWQMARNAASAAAARADWGASIAAAQRALSWLAQDVGDGSPYVPLAMAYEASGQPQRALQALQVYWQRGGHDPQALRELAARLHAAGQLDEAIDVLESVNYVAPLDDELHGRLGDWLLESHRAEDALVEYQVAMALHPPDQATAHLRVARAEFALHALPEARREVLAALEVAPDFEPAQRLLLQIARATGQLPGGDPYAPAAPPATAPPATAPSATAPHSHSDKGSL
jgi:tetratricopeptide (TPR) repeat protein